MPDAGIELKRVVDLVTQSEVDSGVYTLIDSTTGAVKKYPLGSFIVSVAPIFDSTAAYTAGSYCNYNGQIYKFTADHAAGSWTGSDATAVNVGGELSNLMAEISEMSGLSEDIKAALLQIASKVAYIDDDGADYYQDLYDALYPPVELSSISAVYTQSGTVYPTTSLDSLKSDLVVTAHYTDSSAETITTYTLSGTLTAGTSTVTVSYGGKTTTFNVTVTAAPTLSSISAVYTQSGTVYDTDSLDSLKTDLVVTATYSDTSTATVPSTDYTLSGTLIEGTSTITVSYGGKTTTFNVTVLGRSSLFGSFVKGHSVSKITSGTTIPIGGIYISSAAARAAFSTPIENNGYVFTVTDSSKYNIAVYDVANNTPISTSYAGAVEHQYYTGGSKTISWKTSDSVETPYLLIAIKKNDNTAFTDSELANGAEAVFTFTTS